MKRTIKVGASFSGKIATGPYENANPGFYAEEVFDTELEGAALDSLINRRQQELHAISYRQFQGVEYSAAVERIEKEKKGIRLYPRGDKKYPSVTSILGFEGLGFFCSDEDLEQYAAQGIITHARVAHYINTNKWVNPIEIPECWPHLHTLKTGKLGLSWDCADFPAFLKKYPIENMRNGEIVYNDELGYAGTPDFFGVPKFDGAEAVETCFDVKRTVDKVKNFTQTAAYSVPLGVKQLCIIPLNDETQQKFSKPLVSKNVGEYFEIFAQKREAFRKRYGI